MSKTWMLTIERDPERESIQLVKLLQWILKKDIHDWIVAKETGTFGYTHWQIRMRTQYNFEQMKAYFPKAHIEEASNEYRYERKEGNYYSSEDTPEILAVRYGEPRENQRRIVERLDDTNDRTIVCVVDSKGCSGKSWLCNRLYERGLAFYVPPTCRNAQTIIQFVASGYRREKYIIIDIPRSTKWTPELYVAVETVKDGLVYDTRYNATTRNIRGVKVLVMCNTKPNLSKLSTDRWIILDREGRALST
nr:MAG: replication-associated protein [Canine associated porprismacovirus]